MSSADAVTTLARPDRSHTEARRSFAPRLLASELRLVMRRRRNQVILVFLACVPVLLGVVVRLSSPQPGEGPEFLSQVSQNGLFLLFTSLVVTIPFFLPLSVAVASGESVAGEASTGTLRSLLVVPVGRTRVLVVKYAGIVAYAAACTMAVMLSGVVVGWLLFAHGPATLLSGSTITSGDALVRAAVIAAYATVMLSALGAVGLFVSTLTEVPTGAMAATAALPIVMQILDAVPQIGWLHPYLLTHWFLAFGDLLRDPVAWGGMGKGILCAACYIAVGLSLAWSRFTTRDVTS